jgi:alpha-beta hydrolase superfamily lysophospholipase
MVPKEGRSAMKETIETGDGEHVADINGTTLRVSTYRPAGPPRLVLTVFHGMHRDAGPYRDRARPLADKIGAIVVSPEFDAERFSIDLYQRGGVAPHGAFVPPGRRTVDLIAPLMAWARAACGKNDLPAALIGHSAGGQFLCRVAAFARTDAARLVVANPSTWVLPSVTDAVPYGFGGTPDAEAGIRAYLALPITVLLGAEDIGTENLSSEPEAVAQGINRLDRGRSTFAKAKAAAKALGGPFRWRLAEVPGVGHDSAGMFASEQAYEALR